MLTVAQLIGRLDIDDRAWNAKMRSAEGDVDRSKGWLSGLGGVAKGVGLGLIGVGGAAAVMGLKTAAGAQNAQIAFETMLGSGEKAKSFLDDLKAFAASTPFEFPELQTAASSLISAGFAAGDVIPIMTTLGDVTSGMGTGSEGIKRATVALQQMAAAGRITGEDLNQLRDAGVPVFDLLAAATGKSKEEIAGLAAAGKLGKDEMNALFEALETGKGLERFNGLMEKQSKSLGGIWSTIMDTVNMGLAGVIEPLVPLITNLLPKGAAVLQGVFDVLGKGLEWVVGWVTKATDSGGGMASKWAPAFAAVKAAGESFWKAVGGIFQRLRAFWDEWGPVLVKWLQTNIPKAVSFLAGAFSKIGSVVGGVIDVISKIIRYFHDNEDAMTSLKRGAVVLIGTFALLKVAMAAHGAAMAVATAGGLAKWIASTKIVTAVTKAWAAVQWIMNAALTANPIGIVVVALAALAAGLMYAWKHSETFREIVTNAFEWVKDAAGEVADFFTETIPRAWRIVVDYTVNAWNGLVDFIKGIPGRMLEAAGNLWNFVVEKAGQLKDLVIAALVGYFEFVASIPGRLFDLASHLWNWVWELAGNILDNVIAWFAGFLGWVAGLPGLLLEKAGALWSFIWTKAGEIWGNVLTALADFFTWVGNLGAKLAAAAGQVWQWFVDQAASAGARAWKALIDGFTPGGGAPWLPGGMGGWGGLRVPGNGDGGRAVGDGSGGSDQRGFGFGSDGDGARGGMVHLTINQPLNEPTSRTIGAAHDVLRAVMG